MTYNLLQQLGRRLAGRTLALMLMLGGLPLVAAAGSFETADDLDGRRRDLPPITLPNGVAAGDATQNSIVLWARSSEPGPLTFTTSDGGSVTTQVTDPSIPAKVTIAGLAPNTRYEYSVLNAAGDSHGGNFKTPASVGNYVGLRFGAGGDWRGDLLVYPVVENAAEQNLDFFIALGDTTYTDVPSPVLPDGFAHTIEEYRSKHHEVYSTRFARNTLADLRSSTVLYATLDDHEVVDDFSGGAPAGDDIRFEETTGLINDTRRFENGLSAFEEYNPIGVESYGRMDNDERMDGEHKLYRYRTFGSDAALFVLDARSFRDGPVSAPTETPEELQAYLHQMYAPGRTMLGALQLAELKRDLLNAQAQDITWKFVAVPEPIQNLGLFMRKDRFEGYAAERSDLLKFIRDWQITNVVFIAADIHGTVVNNLAYRETWDSPLVHVDAFEVTTGPVAFGGTFGPGVVSMSTAWGMISSAQQTDYRNLPIQPDADSLPNDKDDYVKGLLNRSIAFVGDDPVGLDGSSIDATLLEGDYVAVHTHGWTQFEINPMDQELMVTTYGVPVYTAREVQENPDLIGALQPEIVSRFSVSPKTAPTVHHFYVPYAMIN